MVGNLEMKSKLSRTEFRNRMSKNLKNGHIKLRPFTILTGFSGASKLFYGNFDDTTFRLKFNSFQPKSYVIKGDYKSKNSTLYIRYSIAPNSKYYLIMNTILPIIAGILINVLFLLNTEKSHFEEYIIVNSFVIFIVLFSRWKNKKERKNLEQKFIKIFELF